MSLGLTANSNSARSGPGGHGTPRRHLPSAYGARFAPAGRTCRYTTPPTTARAP